MTEPEAEGEENNLPPRSAASEAYWKEFWRLRSRVILLALRCVEWYVDHQTDDYENQPPELKAAYSAADDEFEAAVREFAMYMLKPVPE